MKLFVAAMGASNYTFAEAVASEGLEDWILAHVRMFAFLGGVPKAVVPDNLKSAVIKADRFDPGLNRTYAEMAAHYGTAILPARPRKPRDKAKVEVAVQVAQRWILARLRNHRFFSLAELNVAIRRLLDELNMRVMRGYGASRADLFATLERPNLQPLPAEPYVFARRKRARVAPDYHVEIDSSWYSVPFALIKQEVDVRISGQTVEIFHRGQRVGSHVRTPGRRRLLRDGDGRSPAPGAGLPHLSGRAVPGQNLWTCACRRGLSAGRHHSCPHRCVHPFDPPDRPPFEQIGTAPSWKVPKKPPPYNTPTFVAAAITTEKGPKC